MNSIAGWLTWIAVTGASKKVAEVKITRMSFIGPATDRINPEVLLMRKTAASYKKGRGEGSRSDGEHAESKEKTKRRTLSEKAKNPFANRIQQKSTEKRSKESLGSSRYTNPTERKRTESGAV